MFSIARLMLVATRKSADAEQDASHAAASQREMMAEKDSLRDAQSQFEASTSSVTKIVAAHDEPAYALGTWDSGDWANDAFFF